MFEEACDVDAAFVSYLLQHAVQDDVRARPAHAGAAQQRQRKNGMNPVFTDLRKDTETFDQILPAVHHHRLLTVPPGFGRLADEAEQRQSELWDAHVGPLGVMVLHHRPLVAPPLLGALWVVEKTGSDEKKQEYCSIKQYKICYFKN